MTATELELAWAAGILDGEGCISISSRKADREHQQQHQFTVTVSCCDWRIPRKLLELFGGRINTFHNARKKPQWREAMRWNVYQRQAAATLEAVMPYLISKREQAEVALEFIGTIAPYGKGRPYRLDSSVVTRREEMAQRLRVLKREEAV